MADNLPPLTHSRLPKPLRVHVLLNISAGCAACADRGELRAAVQASFQSAGILAAVENVMPNELRTRAERVLQKLRMGELDAIVVGGGDGTISTVAGAIAGSGFPIGILPLGTLNHFAKDLGIPLPLEEAVATIASGMQRQVDLGDVNGRKFINNSSIGIYPYIVLDRERRRRSGLPKWIAMVPAMLRVLRNLPLRRLSITINGRSEVLRSPCVFVGNNVYSLALSSRSWRDRMNEGRLCIYVARAQSRAGFVLLALRALLQHLDSARDFQSLTPPQITISSRRKRLLVACDGEVEVISSPLHYSTKPGALLVFAAVGHSFGADSAALGTTNP
jgi:diacylglycerol kinase family enzyme